MNASMGRAVFHRRAVSTRRFAVDDRDGPVAFGVVARGSKETGRTPENAKKTKTYVHVGRATAHLASALLSLVTMVACIDPNLFVEVEKPPLNHAPEIDELSLLPEQTTEPVTVQIGEGCAGETFTVGRIVDVDLEESLRYAWHVTLRVGTDDFGPTLVASGTLPNSDEPTADLVGPSFALTPEILRTASTGQLSSLKDKTHKLAFHVTDANFDADSFRVVPEGGGVDETYWLVFIEDLDCVQ